MSNVVYISDEPLCVRMARNTSHNCKFVTDFGQNFLILHSTGTVHGMCLHDTSFTVSVSTYRCTLRPGFWNEGKISG